MTNQEIREKAANILESLGWCQGSYQTLKPEGGYGYCMFGAARLAVDPTCEAVSEMEESLCEQARMAIIELPLPTGYEEWVDWNDEPGRTKEEVVAVLRAGMVGQ